MGLSNPGARGESVAEACRRILGQPSLTDEEALTLYIDTYAQSDADETSIEASLARFRTRAQAQGRDKRKAAIVCVMGQSNNAPRGTALYNGTAPNAYMPIGGCSTSYWAFASTNAIHSAHYNDIASLVPYAEGVGGTPMPGIIATLLGGRYSMLYICSVAIGARSIEVLSGAGPLGNMEGFIRRACQHAKQLGYDPEVIGNMHHSEAQMAQGDAEDQVYDKERRYLLLFQQMARQAMGKPDYTAPIVFFHPILMTGTVDSKEPRAGHNAVGRLCLDLPGLVNGGPSYPEDSEYDRVHNEETGMITRGERGGVKSRKIADLQDEEPAVEFVDIQYNGSTQLDIIFNQDVYYDTAVTYNWGTLLNTAYQLAGIEVFDVGGQKATAVLTWATPGANGSTVTINGHVVTLVTSGAAGQQINIGATATDTATNFEAYVTANSVAMGVTASRVGAAVTLTAIVDGYAGNDIPVARSGTAGCSFTGSWTSLMFGGAIKVNSVVASGRRVRCTLNSAAVGATTALQVRVAMQATTSALTAGQEYRSGSQIRADKTPIHHTYDPTKLMYEWARPQQGYARLV